MIVAITVTVAMAMAVIMMMSGHFVAFLSKS
jgi:hypothetical protein